MKREVKKCLAVMSVGFLSVGMLMGCGNKAGNQVPEESVEEAVEDAFEELVEDVDKITEEESTVTTPFLDDLEKYESIISTLTTGQYYAFADAGEDYDVLLVADEVYDNGDGNMAAIDATVYAIDNGTPCYAGSVWSDGTAYPIAVYENSLMFGGNHRMVMADVVDAALIIIKEAYEEFDEQANATYFLNEGDIDNIKELDDDSILKELYEIYSKAEVINFFPGEAEATEGPVGDMEVGDYPSNALEEREGKTVFDSYDEIIGLLQGDEGYALVKVKGYDGEVLLVAESVYDDLLGHMATVECTPYTIKADGKATADSLLLQWNCSIKFCEISGTSTFTGYNGENISGSGVRVTRRSTPLVASIPAVSWCEPVTFGFFRPPLPCQPNFQTGTIAVTLLAFLLFNACADMQMEARSCQGSSPIS